jgi:acyl-coenzyme A synthetase/AMP-(fatty) acid ligase
MAQPLDLVPLEWIGEAPFAPDYGGPVGVPYELPEAPPPGASRLWRLRRATERYPDNIAVTDGAVTLTYAAFLDRVSGLAKLLGETVRPGGVVASLMHASAAEACVVTALTASGRTYLQIDASQPIERQAMLLAESHADVVVVEAGGAVDRTVIAPPVRVIEFDVAAPSGVAEFDEAPPSNGPARLAFTSGSTGRPKGLAFPGGEDMALLREYLNAAHLNASDVFVSLTSVGRADLFGLWVGATLHVIDVRRLGLGEALRRIGEAGVTFINFVPTVLRTFLSAPEAREALSSLRILCLFGERILASDVRFFRSLLPADCKINISFASTEAGWIFSWWVRDEAIDGPVAPVGYVAGGKRVALLAEGGGSVASGEVGELVVRGPTALGSWQNGQVTSARFLPDAEDPTSKVYLTGDLVRQRADGLFEFVGRKDRQVKIRGLWADLGEVENALLDVANVADAVVVVREAPGQPDGLAAFVTLAEPSAGFDRVVARRTVRAATAEHMIPADIRVLTAIPRLPNFKPDLRQLDGMLLQPPPKPDAAARL